MTSEHDTRERLLVPIFPLPAAHLFPGGLLPLHVFEPRYRALVAEAVEGSRQIVMGVFRPGWETDYEGRPAIYPLAGLGEMIRVERLADGRWSLLLHGLRRVRILAEDAQHTYRRAVVESLSPAPLRTAELEELPRLLRTFARLQGVETTNVPAVEEADRFVDFLAMQLPIDPHAKQALFACLDPRERARAVQGHLDELLWLRRLAGTTRVRKRPRPDLN